MREKLTALINVKSIVTFALVGTLCGLAVGGAGVEHHGQAVAGGVRVSEELFAAVVTSVITYFFTRKGNTSDDR